MVSFRPIDESNREAVEALDVSPEQQQFVSNAADSIRKAASNGFEQTGEIVFDDEVLLQLDLRQPC